MPIPSNQTQLNNVTGVLLAAGLSTRMGQPKQLLLLSGQPLCRHAAYTLAQVYPRLLAVIPAGKVGEEVRQALAGLGFEYVVQSYPERGLAASFGLAARHLQDLQGTSGAAFALADMPYVSVQTHLALLQAAHSGAELVVTRFVGGGAVDTAAGVQAPPTYFAPPLLSQVAHLTQGDTGPREVLRQHAASAITLLCPAAEGQDIDTPQDYQAALDS